MFNFHKICQIIIGKKLVVALFTALCAVFLQISVKASVEEKSLKQLTTEANSIVLGKVLDTRSYFNKYAEIVTDVTIENQVEIGKSSLDGKYFTITIPGGEVGERGMVVSDMPEFSIDESVLVFLVKKGKTYETVGLSQGKYTFLGDKLRETGQDAEATLNEVFDILEKINEESFQNQRSAVKQFVSNLRMERLLNPIAKNELEISQVLSPCTQPSGIKWGVTNVSFTVGADIPFSWISPIAGGASAWNQAGSRFRFSSGNNNNTITFKNFGSNSSTIALTTTSYNSSTKIISRSITEFNSAKSFSTSGQSGKFDVQNTMAHEFGHWLNLKDISTNSCSAVTMYGYQDYGTTYQRTLEPADKEGIIAIYGR